MEESHTTTTEDGVITTHTTTTTLPTAAVTEVQQTSDLLTSEQAAKHMLLADAFAAFDLDDSGFVEADELLQLGSARRMLGQRLGVW